MLMKGIVLKQTNRINEYRTSSKKFNSFIKQSKEVIFNSLLKETELTM
jgi:hypothetical protein